MQNEKLIGAIIAAGNGKRLYPLSMDIPKALLPVCNKPIIFHQIEYLKGIGVHNIYIVVGFLGDKIRSAVGDGSKFGIDIKYIIQEKPEGSGNAVGQLGSYIKDNFVLFLCDILIMPVNIKKHATKICEANSKNINLIACTVENDIKRIKQNFEVLLGKNGTIVEVKEKPEIPRTSLKGCGLYFFTQDIFEAINHTPKSSTKNEYELTDAIQLLISNKSAIVKPLDVIGTDFNVSSIEDLHICNTLWEYKVYGGSPNEP